MTLLERLKKIEAEWAAAVFNEDAPLELVIDMRRRILLQNLIEQRLETLQESAEIVRGLPHFRSENVDELKERAAQAILSRSDFAPK